MDLVLQQKVRRVQAAVACLAVLSVEALVDRGGAGRAADGEWMREPRIIGMA